MTKRVPEKERILKYITEENVVELAKSLIRIPSPTTYIMGKEPIVGAIPVDHPSHFKMYWVDDDSSLTKGGIISFCYGLVGEGAPGHRCVDIDSMVRVAKSFTLTVYDICTKSKK